MTWTSVKDYLFTNWRDIVSVVGFAITLGTFIVARGAQRAAREAREKVRDTFAKADTVATLATTVETISRIYDMQRKQSWAEVPRLYWDVRQSLARVQGEDSALTQADKTYVLTAVTEFSRIEESIERRLSEGVDIQDMPSLNQILSKHSQEFIKLETSLKRRQEQV